jgi:hypothetical protein
MLDRNRIVAKRRGHIDMKAEPGEQHAGSPAHLAFLNHAKPRRLAAEIEILRHRKIRQQIDLLIDGGDAGIDRSLGRPRRDLDAVEAHDARVAREHAGDQLDQGGFAGAILAEQRMDFAGTERKVDALQCAQRAKTLGDSANLQQRRRGIGAFVHLDITPTGVRVDANARYVHLIGCLIQRISTAAWAGSVAETLLALVDLLRIVGRRVEF